MHQGSFFSLVFGGCHSTRTPQVLLSASLIPTFCSIYQCIVCWVTPSQTEFDVLTVASKNVKLFFSQRGVKVWSLPLYFLFEFSWPRQCSSSSVCEKPPDGLDCLLLKPICTFPLHCSISQAPAPLASLLSRKCLNKLFLFMTRNKALIPSLLYVVWLESGLQSGYKGCI